MQKTSLAFRTCRFAVLPIAFALIGATTTDESPSSKGKLQAQTPPGAQTGEGLHSEDTPDDSHQEADRRTNSQQQDSRLRWWRDARFGMFVHFGPVSLKGTEIGWSRGKEVPEEEYDQLYKRFDPRKFDADTWVTVAKAAGMRYLVFTSKHHDGFCMWDSKFTDYDIMATPFARDLLRELAEACRRHDMEFCTYHSICDWRHPDYPLGSPGGRVEKSNSNMPRYSGYLLQQTTELLENYGPLGVMWFDGEWEAPWTREYGNELYRQLLQRQPSLIINNRVSKGRQGMEGTTVQPTLNFGDYDTPEQRVGGFNRQRPWETCMTICEQWSWKPDDELKSRKECIQALIRTVGGDGNLLLNVGPMPDGRIEPRQVQRLKEVGDWLDVNGAGIYGTRGGPFKPDHWGASTCRRDKIYLFVMNWPEQGLLRLPGIPHAIVAWKTLSGGGVTVKQATAGLTVECAGDGRDDIATVIELTLDGNAVAVAPL